MPQACGAGTSTLTLAQTKALMLSLDYEQQPDINFTQANPVQNTWYTILPATPNVRLQGVDMFVETANETLELRITMTSAIRIGSIAATFGTGYYASLSESQFDGILLGTNSTLTYREFLIEDKFITVEIRKTTNAGNGNLRALLMHAKRV